MKKIGMLIFVISVFVPCTLLGAERFDGIAAVVGDSLILVSELSAYTLMRSTANGATPDSSALPALRKQYLQELIDGKVLIVHAASDTMITVTNEEVENALTGHLQQILAQNNITIDILEKELREKYNTTLSKFKTQLRVQLHEQIVKQKVQQQNVGQVPVSRSDVEAFYNQYKDSLPSIGESVLLSKISVKLQPNDSIRQIAYAKIQGIKKRIDNGEDFAALAKQFSEDPSAENGGDLGFVTKGTLNELRFEEVAFSLAVGQVSGIFESRLGFHIVTAVEKKDQMVHVRQIFVQVAPPKNTIDRIFAQLDSVRQHAKTSADFIAAVNVFSTDNLTKAKNGRVGWLSLYAMSVSMHSIVDSLTAGQISAPVRDGNEISLYRLDERVPNRSLTLADDYDILSEKTKEIMMQKRLIDLVRKWRSSIYVDIRL